MGLNPDGSYTSPSGMTYTAAQMAQMKSGTPIVTGSPQQPTPLKPYVAPAPTQTVSRGLQPDGSYISPGTGMTYSAAQWSQMQGGGQVQYTAPPVRNAPAPTTQYIPPASKTTTISIVGGLTRQGEITKLAQPKPVATITQMRQAVPAQEDNRPLFGFIPNPFLGLDKAFRKGVYGAIGSVVYPGKSIDVDKLDQAMVYANEINQYLMPTVQQKISYAAGADIVRYPVTSAAEFGIAYGAGKVVSTASTIAKATPVGKKAAQLLTTPIVKGVSPLKAAEWAVGGVFAVSTGVNVAMQPNEAARARAIGETASRTLPLAGGLAASRIPTGMQEWWIERGGVRGWKDVPLPTKYTGSPYEYGVASKPTPIKPSPVRALLTEGAPKAGDIIRINSEYSFGSTRPPMSASEIRAPNKVGFFDVYERVGKVDQYRGIGFSNEENALLFKRYEDVTLPVGKPVSIVKKTYAFEGVPESQALVTNTLRTDARIDVGVVKGYKGGNEAAGLLNIKGEGVGAVIERRIPISQETGIRNWYSAKTDWRAPDFSKPRPTVEFIENPEYFKIRSEMGGKENVIIGSQDSRVLGVSPKNEFVDLTGRVSAPKKPVSGSGQEQIAIYKVLSEETVPSQEFFQLKGYEGMGTVEKTSAGMMQEAAVGTKIGRVELAKTDVGASLGKLGGKVATGANRLLVGTSQGTPWRISDRAAYRNSIITALGGSTVPKSITVSKLERVPQMQMQPEDSQKKRNLGYYPAENLPRGIPTQAEYLTETERGVGRLTELERGAGRLTELERAHGRYTVVLPNKGKLTIVDRGLTTQLYGNPQAVTQQASQQPQMKKPTDKLDINLIHTPFAKIFVPSTTRTTNKITNIPNIIPSVTPTPTPTNITGIQIPPPTIPPQKGLKVNTPAFMMLPSGAAFMNAGYGRRGRYSFKETVPTWNAKQLVFGSKPIRMKTRGSTRRAKSGSWLR